MSASRASAIPDRAPESNLQAMFSPYRLGGLELPNRVVMSPMTRSRAIEGNVPNPLAATYYAQRASAGSRLLVFPNQAALAQQSACISRIAQLGLGRISRLNDYECGRCGDCTKAESQGYEQLPRRQLHAC